MTHMIGFDDILVPMSECNVEVQLMSARIREVAADSTKTSEQRLAEIDLLNDELRNIFFQ